MSTNWADVAKSLAPIGAATVAVVGVVVGARLTRTTASNSFLRERIFKEVDKRRDVATQFRKALWSYSSRVQKMRDLALEFIEARKTDPNAEVKFNLTEARACHRAVLDAFAELEVHAVVQVQQPARNCMEALTGAFNSLAELDVERGSALLAFHAQQYEVYSLEINKDVEHYNRLIYAEFTPLWRVVLGRLRRKPLPYKVGTLPAELNDKGEGVFSNRPS